MTATPPFRPQIRGDHTGDQAERWAAEDADFADDAEVDDDRDQDGGYRYAGAGAAAGRRAGDGGDYELVRPESSRGRRVLTVVVAVFALLVVVAGAAGIWVQRRIDPPGAPGEETAVVIPTGSSTSAIAAILEDEGIIADAQVFRYYARVQGDDGGFQAGEYLLATNSAMGDVLDTLAAGPVPPSMRRFTIPEGLTVDEMAARLAEEVPGFELDRVTAGLASVRPQTLPAEVTSLEGHLFPDTYELPAEADEAAALAVMAAQFDAVATETGLVAGAAARGLTPYEIVTVASLIQEEAGIVEDMPKIARVIYNRLELGEPLGIDATSCYLVEERPCRLTTSDLASDNPYNTRVNQGLPPTPIAAPGRDAILAALQPADGPWIFYVLDPDESRTLPGGHFFTDSASEFAAVKAECEAAGLGCG